MVAALIALVLSVMYLFIFALCRAAGRADELAEKMYFEALKKEKEKNDADIRNG